MTNGKNKDQEMWREGRGKRNNKTVIWFCYPMSPSFFIGLPDVLLSGMFQ